MIKQPGLVRALVLSDVDHMLKHSHARLTLLETTELDALTALEQPHLEGLIVDVTNFILARFGHLTQPCEPRFDKSRRTLAKKTPKGPRGEPRPRANNGSQLLAANGLQPATD